MKKAKLALTALMIGTLTVTGASFAEAGVKLDDIKIGVHFKNDHKPPERDRHEAPRPPEGHGPHGHKGPAPRPAHKHWHSPAPHRPHGPGHHVPPPPHAPHHGGHR